ncbi:DUF6304 family protein [Streptomyces hypolithicus]
MMEEPWAGWYRDREGSVAVTFTVNGRRLRTRIREFDFEGDHFNALAPVAGMPSDGARYTLSDGALCDCVLEWDIPVPVDDADGRVRQATLSCLLALGRPLPDGTIDREHLALTLHFDGAAYESRRAERDFGHALAAIQQRLPEGAYLRGMSDGRESADGAGSGGDAGEDSLVAMLGPWILRSGAGQRAPGYAAGLERSPA